MNPVTHFEIPYKNIELIATFYKNVFNWELNNLGPQMNNYVLATTATQDVKKDAPRGAINGGLYPYKEDWSAQYPSLVIGVENLMAKMELIHRHGGEVLGEPHHISGFGLYISFMDPEGNRMSMIEPKM